MTRRTITFVATPPKKLRVLLTASLVSWVLVACASGPTQEITVAMTDSGMAVEPTLVGDAASFEFRFINSSSNSRHPVVVVTGMSPGNLQGYIEQNGIEEVINALLSEQGSATWEFVYPGIESGQHGHYHPGEHEPDLPQRALTRTSNEGEVVQYLYTDEVEPASKRTERVTCCKPGITYGNRGGGTTFLVLTIDGSDQHAIFDLQPSG